PCLEAFAICRCHLDDARVRNAFHIECYVAGIDRKENTALREIQRRAGKQVESDDGESGARKKLTHYQRYCACSASVRGRSVSRKKLFVARKGRSSACGEVSLSPRLRPTSASSQPCSLASATRRFTFA